MRSFQPPNHFIAAGVAAMAVVAAAAELRAVFVAGAFKAPRAAGGGGGAAGVDAGL